MSYRQAMIRIVSILLLSTGVALESLSAQSKPPPPDPPVMDYVSVDTATGHVNIYWDASPSPDVDRYIIYEWRRVGDSYAGFEIGIVGKDTLEFIHITAQASDQAMKYRVAATRPGSDPSPLSDSIHATMHLSTRYDSCQKTTTLSWTPYQGWGGTLNKYEAYVSVDGGTFTILDPDGTRDTVAIHTGIEDNRTYRYFIKAIRPDPSSFSNVATRVVDHPDHPAWINAESASVAGTDQVELKFAIDPDAEVSSYQLFKASGPDKPWIGDQIFTGVSDSITHTDPILSITTHYRYKLASLDVCNNPVVESQTCGNMLLVAEAAGLQANLAWYPYEQYEAGVKSYRVWRQIRRGQMLNEPVLIFTHTANDTIHTDDLSIIKGTEVEDEVCYFIEAVEEDGFTRGQRGLSRSNLACVSVVPEIIMANAFTPNGDGRNDRIAPMLTFEVAQGNYVFQVFDRWGSKVFETMDDDIGWDGKIGGGADAPEGVYLYYVKLITSNGIEVEQRGLITLFYP